MGYFYQYPCNRLHRFSRGTIGTKSPRVVRIPIYHPDASYNGGLNTPSAGKSTYQPLGFIGFWIQDVQYSPPNNGTIVGRFVTVEGYGSGSGGGGAGRSGSPVLNIRLVE